MPFHSFAFLLLPLMEAADVAAVVHAVPVDLRGGLVTESERFVERRGGRGDADDAPARRHERAVVGACSPRVENLYAGDARGFFEAGDARAGLRSFGIAARGEHDAGRGFVAPPDLDFAETHARDRVENLEEVAAQP